MENEYALENYEHAYECYKFMFKLQVYVWHLKTTQKSVDNHPTKTGWFSVWVK